ncbi:MAG: PepSY domain-containing protein [Gammaproteobacteria bacterium]
MRFRRLTRQVHRWLGLLIGLQVLLWVTGGVVMSVLRLDEVRGEHLAAQRVLPALGAADSFVPVAEVLRRHAGGAPQTVTLTTLLGRPVYHLSGGGKTWLVDAGSGAALSPLPAADAEAVARADYSGAAALGGMDWVTEPVIEIRGRDLPLWRARFGDSVNTALYVSPDTGAVVARRNDLWRTFDFVWMLHIMDYKEREDFNHPLLIATAATALLFVFSGLTMLVFSFRRKA